MWKNKHIAKALIVIGGFVSYFLADGCTFSIGILYSEFLDFFHQSKASTAILPGLVYALPQILGPIICPFVDATGSCFASVLGGVILSASLFLSRFVFSLQLMYVTMGFFASIGLELTYASAIIAVTKSFNDNKYLGLAVGITVSGSGIGVFVFNPFLNYLISTYAWQGALTIKSALFLHIIPAGIIFKLALSFFAFDDCKPDKKPVEKNIMNVEIIKAQEMEDKYPVSITLISHSDTVINETADNEKKDDYKYIRSKGTTLNNGQRSSVYLSMTQTKYCEPFYKPISHLHHLSASLDRRINGGDSFSVSLPVDERSISFVRRLSTYSTQNMKGSRQASQESLSSRPSLLFENSETDNILEKISTKENEEFHVSNQWTNNRNWKSKLELFIKNLKTSFSPLMSLSFWNNKELLTFYIVSFLFGCSVVALWTFSHNYTTTMNIEGTKASVLVSLIGAGACIGQITFGLLSEYIPAISLYAIGCLIAGIIMTIIWSISAYWALSILHFAFGFGQGVSYALFSSILLKYTSIELYPASLGIFLLLSGCGNLLGTSLSGYINDVTGSYRYAFLISGFVLILCSIISIPLIYLWKKKN